MSDLNYVRGLENDSGTAPLDSTIERKLAIISVGELFGGVERHILGMLTGLKHSAWAPILLLFHDGELAAQARNLGVEPVLLPEGNARTLSAAYRLKQILAEHSVQIVHAHGYKAMVISGIARCMCKFVLVKTEHGLPEPMLGRPVSSFKEIMYRKLDAWVVRRFASAVFYVTDELDKFYLDQHRDLKRFVISNGVGPVERADPKNAGEMPDDKFCILIAGRIDTVKGHEFAIRALAGSAVPKEVELFVIGDGPQLAQMKGLAERCGLSDRVHFLGFRRNIMDYMARADALLMPSLHEGLPYTLLEAMAMSKTIIASRVGGLAEVLDDMETALLVPVGDVAALSQAIVRIYSDADLRKRLGDNALKAQTGSYSLSSMAAKYQDVYGQLLAMND